MTWKHHRIEQNEIKKNVVDFIQIILIKEAL